MNLNEMKLDENCEKNLRPLYLLKVESSQKIKNLSEKITNDIIEDLLSETSDMYKYSYKTILQFLFSKNHEYDKEKIYDELGNMYKEENILEVSKQSLIAKQALKKLLELNESERKEINDEFLSRLKDRNWNYKEKYELEENDIYNLNEELYNTICQNNYIYIEDINSPTNIKLMYIYENGIYLSIKIINGVYSSKVEKVTIDTVEYIEKYMLENEGKEPGIYCYIEKISKELNIKRITYEIVLEILNSINLNPEYFINLADVCSRHLSCNNVTIQDKKFIYDKVRSDKKFKVLILEYYKIAVSLKSKKANYLLGRYFQYIEENFEKAKEYYDIAISYGNEEAYVDLGRTYTAEISKKNLENIYDNAEKAIECFEKIKSTNGTGAKNEIDIVKKKLKEMEKEKFVKEIYQEVKKLTTKKCYEIKVEEGTPEILDSKISGKPYLPIGAEYPKNAKGEFLALLIQINFDKINLENYPNKGILQVFMNKDCFNSDEFAIRYYENIEQEYQTDLPVIDTTKFITCEPMKISFTSSTTHMPISDYRFEDIVKEIYEKMNESKNIKLKKYELIDKIGEIMDYPYEGLIGGYADFVQYDIRKETKAQKYTDSLIKIDIGLDKRFNGDGDVINVLIALDDLKNKKFENAIVYRDCC